MENIFNKVKSDCLRAKKQVLQMLLAVTLIPYFASLVILLSGFYANAQLKVICIVLSVVVFAITCVYIYVYTRLIREGSMEYKPASEVKADTIKKSAVMVLSFLGFFVAIAQFAIAITAVLAASLSGFPLFIVVVAAVFTVAGLIYMLMLLVSWILVEFAALIIKGVVFCYNGVKVLIVGKPKDKEAVPVVPVT